MQTEAPTLPVVQLDVHKTFNRSTLLPSNKRCLNPLLGGPYKSTTKQTSLSDEPKPSNKSILGQRIMSAKMLRFKQLQNQLADAHYHLNELANENRLLKALQKRQDSALRRYEGTNAELPRIINSHHEELRILQAKYKKLKELHKDTCNLLKEKESELHSVNSQNKHLLQLSKDRNLGEREKLQLQISDMDHKVQQQQETIQLLHRKLALETKSMKHQLHVEISKHKETQKNLQETIEKLKTLESLLDNREKRLYYNGQLPIHIKEKKLGSHSLTNLRDISTPVSVKTFNRNRRSGNGVLKDNLPFLDTLESNDDEIVPQTNNINHGNSVDQLKSETMASLQRIRKFRLQKSPHMRKNAHSMDDLRIRFKDTESRYDDEKDISYQNAPVDLKATLQRNSPDNDERGSGKLRKLFNRMKEENSQKLQKGMNLTDEFDYTSDDGESENASEQYHTDTAQKSRELYARLISSTDDASDTLDDMTKRVCIERNNEEKEELSTHPAKDSTFQKHKYRSKLEILHHRDKDLYDSNSETDSEKEINTNQDYSSIEHKTKSFPTNLSRYEKKQYNKSFNDTVYSGYKTSETKERHVIERSENAEISTDSLDNVRTDKVEESQQSMNANNTIPKEHVLGNTVVNNTFTDIEKEDHMKEEEAKYLEDKSMYSDILHNKVYHNTSKQNNACDEAKRSSPGLERKENQCNSQRIHEEHDVISKMKLLDFKEMEYATTENSKIILNKNKHMSSHPDGSNNSVQSLVNECHKPKVDEILSRVHHSDESTLDENNSDIETKNILNASSKAKPVNTSSNNAHIPHQTELTNGTKTVTIDTKQRNGKRKVINYNKEKLLATMKAIDNNENIEFLNHSFKNHNVVNRTQITENLYRGLPTHSKTKRDIIKDIFEDDHIEDKSGGTCSKSH